MRVNKYIFIFLISILVLSCKQGDTTSIDDKLFEYQEKGWKSNSITHFINHINYTATEVPLEYYLLKNEAKDKIDSIYKLHERERVLEVEFQHTTEKNLLLSDYTHRDYRESVEYMAFTIKKDFQVITTTSKDTILCSGVLFERNFKVAPFKRLLLYFDGIDPDDSIKLLYDDQLFGNGLLKFNFSERPIKL